MNTKRLVHTPSGGAKEAVGVVHDILPVNEYAQIYGK